MARLGKASRTRSDPPMTMGPQAGLTPIEAGVAQIQMPPPQSDEQGVGRSPGFQWPKQRLFQALVPKVLKQGAVGATAAGRQLPSRPERQRFSGAYLLYYEQVNRHVWPGTPGEVIEHPDPMPLVATAPRL